MKIKCLKYEFYDWTPSKWNVPIQIRTSNEVHEIAIICRLNKYFISFSSGADECPIELFEIYNSYKKYFNDPKFDSIEKAKFSIDNFLLKYEKLKHFL